MDHGPFDRRAAEVELMRCFDVRRQNLLVVGLSAAFGLALLTMPPETHAQPASTGSAQAYPAKPIRLILPFPPGTGPATWWPIRSARRRLPFSWRSC